MLSYFHILLLLKGAIMRQKNICYFRQNESTNETVHILDCGYHETTQGQPSAQTVIDHYVLHCIVKEKVPTRFTTRPGISLPVIVFF